MAIVNAMGVPIASGSSMAISGKEERGEQRGKGGYMLREGAWTWGGDHTTPCTGDA